MSVTSAVRLAVPPAATVNVVSGAAVTWSEMVFGGHPMKVAGVPVVDPTEATIVVAPGPLEVATPFASTAPTAAFADVQLNGPTFEVMSVPALNACAENCSV